MWWWIIIIHFPALLHWCFKCCHMLHLFTWCLRSASAFALFADIWFLSLASSARRIFSASSLLRYWEEKWRSPPLTTKSKLQQPAAKTSSAQQQRAVQLLNDSFLHNSEQCNDTLRPSINLTKKSREAQKSQCMKRYQIYQALDFVNWWHERDLIISKTENLCVKWVLCICAMFCVCVCVPLPSASCTVVERSFLLCKPGWWWRPTAGAWMLDAPRSRDSDPGRLWFADGPRDTMRTTSWNEPELGGEKSQLASESKEEESSASLCFDFILFPLCSNCCSMLTAP